MDASPNLSKVAFITVPHLKRQLVTLLLSHTGAGLEQVNLHFRYSLKYQIIITIQLKKPPIQRFRAHFLLLFAMSSFSDRNTGWNSRS